MHALPALGSRSSAHWRSSTSLLARFCGDGVIASAILDRLHHSEIFAINGPSYRLEVPFQSDTAPRAEPDSSGMSTKKRGKPSETGLCVAAEQDYVECNVKTFP